MTDTQTPRDAIESAARAMWAINGYDYSFDESKAVNDKAYRWIIEMAEAALAHQAPGEVVGWRCFHCGDYFTSKPKAELHFGMTEFEQPACLLKGSDLGLLGALRKTEEACRNAHADLHNENGDAIKALYAAQSRFNDAVMQAEQSGYDKGLADGRAGAISTPPTQEEAPTAAQGDLAGELELLIELMQNQIELNPSNYGHDDACHLNSEAVEIYSIARDLFPRILTALRADQSRDSVIEECAKVCENFEPPVHMQMQAAAKAIRALKGRHND